MDKMKSQHADLVQVMTSFGKDIDDKMKDIRSLLLGKGNKDTDSTLLKGHRRQDERHPLPPPRQGEEGHS
jgi:hypothetical protein